ncbi:MULTISPECIES: hypothetical protein [Alphaproteobacteria]|uniref:Uncharacterized protein n=2 Tax=Alphaproteobacteria TaxID=28211 RepID=A0A512HNJ4_9HYPH|nr:MULTISPECIES: hypothetical protein [Alphaproteobacteria]GEO87028.1 hypothetical protein RNA01_39600 [Ciceribacter naphthalenivorans]GLR21596.1 hypothetical protein GCM10007920_13820 [Ciceribacter naphthalenivorans]GLT04452.1 hypothetical protein GCM10007926_13820 [Sphingomonas psychrolutea]
MTNRKLLLAAVAGAAILAAFASQALPLHALRIDGATTDVVNADYDEHRGKGHHEGHRRYGTEDGRYAANDCRGDDEDDDDGDAACGGRGVPMQQNANPPSNGLFTPGSKPRAQMN